MVISEYHQRPRGHLVFDAQTWERVKQTLLTGHVDYIVGPMGRLDGAPVYIDSCPWNCHE